MAFSAKQLQELKKDVDPRHLRSREINGRELTYIEGWHAMAEANRIFGYDGWSRETLDSKCVLSRENRGSNHVTVYTAKVRITVRAKDQVIVREGHGTGEGRGSSLGEAHDFGLKAAETDATKRALATFGKPFGLGLYGGLTTPQRQRTPAISAAEGSVEAPATSPIALPPDDTTPIPRPSQYYGHSQDVVTRDRLHAMREPNSTSAIDTPLAPADAEPPELAVGKIDKSVLTIGAPRRFRDKGHLRFVASHPCLICGRQPADAHHIQFAQPRAMGLKVSDEFTVPLCRTHHRQLHQAGNEVAWWEKHNIRPLEVAERLWIETRLKLSPAIAEQR
ncbi:MAG TPA: Rad52/Rad22 family DNA repair protein [Pseudolabrys sp.]|nr:Rad52/Rad22 family DNA repair protein [Pseudolabrys sp.]